MSWVSSINSSAGTSQVSSHNCPQKKSIGRLVKSVSTGSFRHFLHEQHSIQWSFVSDSSSDEICTDDELDDDDDIGNWLLFCLAPCFTSGPKWALIFSDWWYIHTIKITCWNNLRAANHLARSPSTIRTNAIMARCGYFFNNNSISFSKVKVFSWVISELSKTCTSWLAVRFDHWLYFGKATEHSPNVTSDVITRTSFTSVGAICGSIHATIVTTTSPLQLLTSTGMTEYSISDSFRNVISSLTLSSLETEPLAANFAFDVTSL